LEVLRHCFPTNLRNILEELPKSLDETYKRILKEINNANQEHAYRLLQCLTVASRPLRIEELTEVLAVDFNPGGIAKLKAEWRWEDQEAAVLSACSSLVSVITDNGHRVVQFSHFSVKEYLTSDRLASSTDEVSRFHIPIEPSHAILAQACLGVLLCLDDRTDEGNVEEKFPLGQYAAEYWVGHAQVGSVELRMKDALDQFFDLDNPHFSAWTRIKGEFHLTTTVSNDEWPRDVPLSAAPLHFAAENGLRGLVERLVIKHPRQVNQRGGRHGTPFHSSVEGGHIEVVQLLLAHGADVNTPYNTTPLASQNGHHEIGGWPLNDDVDVNRERDGWTPLHVAVAYGQLEVSRVLLEHNAAVDAWNGDGITPLLYMSKNGNLDLVRLLLNHHADVHEHDGRRNTPLHLAVAYGHVEVSRMLLERGAKPNVWNDGGSTPLLAASTEGFSEVVQLLLDHDAQVHVHDNNGNTPLHSAAANGHVEIARILLLDRRVEINSRDDGGCTPLHVASREGYPDIVQLLLDHGAHVHVHANLGNTPLHRAATNGHTEAARILLEHDAQVDTRNNRGSTSLHVASAGGYSDVVRLLLDYDARVRVHDNNGKSPLHYANVSGHVEVARILLERDAELTLRGDYNSTLALSEDADPNPPPYTL
jgi:ankyrin repeat protein